MKLGRVFKLRVERKARGESYQSCSYTRKCSGSRRVRGFASGCVAAYAMLDFHSFRFAARV
jgi:hypothetical protein